MQPQPSSSVSSGNKSGSVAVVDYGSGNLRSVAKALEHCGAGSVTVTADPDAVKAADRIVLPGVGAFGDCRAGLFALDGMAEALIEAVTDHAKPFLGICVGMQLMATVGEEFGSHAGFGWIPGRVTAVKPADPSLKIPHMGWNQISFENPSDARHPVLAGIADGAYAYFVHSFHVECETKTDRLACVEYGGPLTAIIGRDTMIGAQFHPEKSQATGLKLIENFLSWSP